ncbi:hypothetical protein QQS21_004210 [Conoideocrella luteorostrata]|uniref:Uncharacterized protein n=1 Tax=Conoideocrella luteorostrata TaxID=1105319 RepID=A0AAJ0CRU6_9HYPO|nr:hypothetical protein QQS21_004210 [Conoideocrella luteorostrata]
MAFATHIHWKQDEYFRIEQGALEIHKNGQQVRIGKENGIVKVPAGTRHKFKALPSDNEDVIFEVWAQPQDLGNSFDEKFIRNLVGYEPNYAEYFKEPELMGNK